MWRFALVAILSTLLTGCFASDKPMFPESTAQRILGEGGHYATFEQDGGKENPSDPIDVKPAGIGYDFVNEKGAVTPATFHPLPNGEHVGQFKLNGDAGYGYAIVHVREGGRELMVVPAECNKQDEKAMTALGVVRRNQFECRIDKVADPVAFFANVKRSPPVSRMVRK